ncbi:MAG: PAS domain-containing sensor histidine kinase [Rhizobiales bacterium]|nr:PAS domain-containing sensor histidine kinase [Hyphomicrobiales bacterium]
MPKPEQSAPAIAVETTSDRSRIVRIIGFVTALAAMVSAAVSFAVLMGFTSIEPDQHAVRIAVIVNGALISILVGAILWEIVIIANARRNRRAASRLHIRVVALFSLVAVAPAILVAIVAGITLDRGLDRWFDSRTKEIVNTSRSVAQAYIQEHTRILANDIISISGDFERAGTNLSFDKERVRAYLTTQARLRRLTAILLLDAKGNVIARSPGPETSKLPIPSQFALRSLTTDEVALQNRGFSNVAGAAIKLGSYEEDTYLYLAKALNPKVLEYVLLVNERAAEYRRLEQSRLEVQLAFGLLYIGIALIVLISAIWIGINFANRLVAPIRRLMTAASEISTGNLSVSVPWNKHEGDLGELSQTFNTMTEQLRNQRDDLILAKDQMDERRRFNEAVLAGVTAGVLGIEPNGNISLANISALRILGADQENLLNQNVVDAIPELESIVKTALEQQRPLIQDQVTLKRKGEERTLNVRITMEQSDEKDHRFVITLDEITDLISAQRRSAWADVARRIAHEIKNPLTPIQLSAERLQRRYGNKLESDREVFDQCTATIVRQVGDIGRMVDEFASFARMPQPVMAERNLTDAIKEAVFLQEVANPDIKFDLNLPDKPMLGYFDHRLISQAFTNLVKNATESIAAIETTESRAGKITVNATQDEDWFNIQIIDNGIGFPKENRSKLLEPYMTTRDKGTGLGLAIVRKIFEEHGGTIILQDAPEIDNTENTGAMVSVKLPIVAKNNTSDAVEPE